MPLSGLSADGKTVLGYQVATPRKNVKGFCPCESSGPGWIFRGWTQSQGFYGIGFYHNKQTHKQTPRNSNQTLHLFLVSGDFWISFTLFSFGDQFDRKSSKSEDTRPGRGPGSEHFVSPKKQIGTNCFFWGPLFFLGDRSRPKKIWYLTINCFLQFTVISVQQCSTFAAIFSCVTLSPD